jgi:hypothetical protein
MIRIVSTKAKESLEAPVEGPGKNGLAAAVSLKVKV